MYDAAAAGVTVQNTQGQTCILNTSWLPSIRYISCDRCVMNLRYIFLQDGSDHQHANESLSRIGSKIKF